MARVPYSQAENEWLRDRPDLTPAQLWATWPFPVKRTISALCEQRKRIRRGEVIPGIGVQETDDAAERLKRLGKVADLLKRSGIDPDHIGKVERVRLNEWDGFIKNAEGEIETTRLEAASLILSPSWDAGPQWPVVQPSPPLTVSPVKLPQRQRMAGMQTAVILPDMQIGYYRDRQEQLHPTHDEAALSVALQILQAAQPDRVILGGDTLDFPELAKYRKEPAFAQTTQATVNRGARLLAEIRANIRKQCVIDWLEGNHEVRLAHYVKDNAAAAFGLRPGDAPDAWPVLSVPTLCRLSDFGVTYHAGYPANVLWLSDRLMVKHGHRAAKTVNASAYLDDERVSVIYFHIHRREQAERTRQTRYGPRTTLAACPGCLCRVDGVVPSTKGGHDLDGQPVPSAENWQQGLAVVSYTVPDGPFVYEPIPIHDGQAFWRGERYGALCDTEGMAA